MSTIQIICPNCQQQVGANDVNIASTIAKCSHCNHLFHIEDQLQQSDDLSTSSPAKKQLNMPMPKGIETYEWGGELHIEQKWRHWLYLIFGIFSLPWLGAVAAWMWLAPFPLSLFGMIHGTVGLIFLYIGITGWLNVTHINVNQYDLSIQHKPLWWFGNKTIPTSNIKQVYCQVNIKRNKGSETRNYDVFVMTQDDKSIKILSQLMKKEQALYIEQAIERFLQIENTPVSGAINE